MQKTQIEKISRDLFKGLEKRQDRSKGVPCVQITQRGRKAQRTLITKEAMSFDSTYLKKMKTRKRPSLLGRKKMASHEVMSMMMLCFFELSRHPLQG
jgi:hypothetical protein